ncbi:MAG: TetR/AcrR family transcriptional regulator [Alphaproteobacteria bacterium]|nr:TetR/AcrR family transcriptional regulator [Alphaproteobacteria bacterium]
MVAAKRTVKRKDALPGRILDTAVELAEESGWNELRLRHVAERLGVSLETVLSHYRDHDAVADAWFARALAAMLAPPPRGFATLPARERLFRVFMRWFDAQAAHRRVSSQMIATKLYLPHLHHWTPLVFNLSRLIGWVREAALCDAGGRRRQVEEIGLTLLFLATLAVWLRDESPQQAETRDFLHRKLGSCDRLMARMWAQGYDSGSQSPPESRSSSTV